MIQHTNVETVVHLKTNKNGKEHGSVTAKLHNFIEG